MYRPLQMPLPRRDQEYLEAMRAARLKLFQAFGNIPRSTDLERSRMAHLNDVKMLAVHGWHFTEGDPNG